MTFWNGADGSAEKSHAGSFKLIPDGTKAPAMIKSFELDEREGYDPVYTVQWKLVDGEFKNQEVRQKIAVFEKDEKKRTRALNMLMRLYKLLQIAPPLDAPTSAQLLEFKGKILGIKIMEWSMSRPDGTIAEGNWVAAVEIADANFQTETGEKSVRTSMPTDSALQRQANAQPLLDGDIPF